jgi:hypothetical protein
VLLFVARLRRWLKPLLALAIGFAASDSEALAARSKAATSKRKASAAKHASRASRRSPSSRRAAGGLRVWYRSSEGCPEGKAFIHLLDQLGRPAVLAGVGERVDFVVTVSDLGTESRGRLERQSHQQIVPIRDAVSTTCDEVADALALGIDRALEPGGDVPQLDGEESRAARSQATQRQSTQPRPPSHLTLDTGAVRALAERPVFRNIETDSMSENWETRLGTHGGVISGLAQTVLPGMGAFVELRFLSSPWATRMSVNGSFGESRAAADLNLALCTTRPEIETEAALGAARSL